AATSHLGFAPRPAQVSPEGLRYFGGTFFPFKTLPPPRTTLRPPIKAVNCFSSSTRRLCSVSSTRIRRSMSASTVIPDRFTFGIVISACEAARHSGGGGPYLKIFLAHRIVRHPWRLQILMQIELGNLA